LIKRIITVLGFIDRTVTRWAMRFLACLMGGMTTAIVLAIISRFIVKVSMPWTEEVARYLMIWAAFIGGSLGLKRGVHVGIVFVVNRIPWNLRRWVSLVAKLSVLFFFIVVILEGFRMTMFVSTQLSPVLRISMAWVYSALPVGGILLLFYTVQPLFEDLKNFFGK